MDSADRV